MSIRLVKKIFLGFPKCTQNLESKIRFLVAVYRMFKGFECCVWK